MTLKMVLAAACLAAPLQLLAVGKALLQPFGSESLVQGSGNWTLQGQDSLEVYFEAAQDLEARGLALRLASQVPEQAYLLSLYEAQGSSCGRLLASGGGVQASAEAAWLQTWIDGVPLKKGAAYVLKLEWDRFRGGTHPVAQGQASARIPWVALQGAPGARARTLLRGAEKAKALKGEPLWAVLGRGRRILGQAWSEPLARPLFGPQALSPSAGGHWQAQVMHFPCGYTPTRIRARVRRLGQPKQPLNWMILKHYYHEHKTVPLVSGELKLKQPKSKDWQWAEAELPQGLSMPPECHYIALSSASGQAQGDTCQDCYEVSGSRIATGLDLVHELSWRGGAHRDRASASQDGQPWRDDYEADLNILLLGPPCEEQALPEKPPLLPTPVLSSPWPR